MARSLTVEEVARVKKILRLESNVSPIPWIEHAILFALRHRLNTVEKVLENVAKGDSPLQFLINADLLAWTLECIAQRRRSQRVKRSRRLQADVDAGNASWKDVVNHINA